MRFRNYDGRMTYTRIPYGTVWGLNDNRGKTEEPRFLSVTTI